MPNKQRKLLQAPVQLSLFDFDPTDLQPSPRVGSPTVPTNTAPSSERPEKTPRKRQLLAGAHLIEYALRRSKRRSIGFLIEEDGLRVTAPRWVTIAEIEDAIRSKHRWIIKKLNEQREYWASRKKPLPLCDGAPVAYLGQTYTLRLQTTTQMPSTIRLDEAGKCLMLSLNSPASEDRIRTALDDWLKQEARRIFAERLPVFAEKLSVGYRAFALSSATTQWGSCTAEGNIRLNWRLIHLPLQVIDYVIAHELSHRREMNHSAKFWHAVQSVLPAYRETEKTLKKYSPCLIQHL